MMNGPKHMDLRVIPARQVEGSRLAQSGAFLPLTLTLSPRERAGVRATFAKHSLRFKPILGIVEVRAGRLPK